MNPFLKNTLPHLLVLVAFFMITLVYFYPNFQGKVLNAHDNLTSKGNSKEVLDHRKIYDEQPFWTNSLFSGMPAFLTGTTSPGNLISYIYKATSLGMSPVHIFFLYMVGFYILLLVLGLNHWQSAIGAISFGLSTYLIIIIGAGHNTKAAAIAYMAPIIAGVLLAFRKKYLLGGIITALFLALQLRANHLQITYYLLIILLVYGGFKLYEVLKTREYSHFVKALGVLMIGAILAIGTNSTKLMLSMQYTKDSTRGKSELTLDAANKTSGLDKDYVTDWSYGVAESFTLLIPGFHGGASSGELDTKSATYKALQSRGIPNARKIIKQVPVYWGDQPMTSGPVYVGAVICFLFVLGLFVVKGPMKWWLLSVTILSIVLSWGKHFPPFIPYIEDGGWIIRILPYNINGIIHNPITDFFLNYVPLYNKFRSVSMTLVIAELAIPLLGFVALWQVIKGKISSIEAIKGIKWSTVITGGLCLLFVLLPGMFFDFSGSSDPQLKASGWPDFLIDALREDRKSLLIADSFRSLVFILLTASLIWLVVKGKLKENYLYLGLLVIVLADLWPVNKRFVSHSDFANKKQSILTINPSQADLAILQQEFTANQGAQELYQELLVKEQEAKKKGAMPGNRNLTDLEKLDLRFAALKFNSNYRVMNLSVSTFNDASTGYFHKSVGGYHGAKMKRYQELISSHLSQRNPAVLNMLNTRYLIVPGQNRNPTVQQNPGALGNSWFVKTYQLVDNADEEIAALVEFDPSQVAIIDKRYANYLNEISPDTNGTGTITQQEYKPNRLVYKSQSSSNGLAVFSEIFYQPGWNAYLDGELVDHFRVNYVLRGMVVPAGEHQIEFRFEPELFIIGERIAFASSSLLILLFLGVMIREIRSKVQSPTTMTESSTEEDE